MLEFKNISLIMNVNSRRSRDWRRQIVRLSSKLDIDIRRQHFINSRDDFTKAIATEMQERPDLLIVGGGDGTIHSVINLIDLQQTTLAILPLGTVNNFARSLKIKRNIRKALTTIANGKIKKVHLGQVNGHRFTNLAAVGVSANVAQNVSDKTKRVAGKLAYYMQGLYEIIVHKPFVCEVNIDDGETKIFYTHQIVIANGDYSGKVRFIPGANIDAGHLMMVIFGRDKRRWVHLKNIIYFIVPSWLRAQPLAIKAEKITIHTNPVRAIEVDGEAVSHTPAEFTIEKRILSVIVP